MTGDWTVVRHPLRRTLADASVDELLALLARPFPYTLRPTLVGTALELHGPVGGEMEVGAERIAWLHGLGDGFDAPAALGCAAPAADLAVIEAVAGSRGWTVTPAGDDGWRLGVPEELDDPPLAVRPADGGLVLERPLVMLPLPQAGAAVRWAVAHAALARNAALRVGRVAVRDPRALTLAVEVRLPAERLDEDEAALLLDGLRAAARHTKGLFDCLRHPAVAAEYGAAHNLPTTAVGQHREGVSA